MGLISLRQLLDHAAENGSHHGLKIFEIVHVECRQGITQPAIRGNKTIVFPASPGSYASERMG